MDAEFAHEWLCDLRGGGDLCIREEARQVAVIVLDRLHAPPFFYLDVFEELCLEVLQVGGHVQIIRPILCDAFASHNIISHYFKYFLFLSFSGRYDSLSYIS